MTGFVEVSQNEMMVVDGGKISFVEICHVIVTGAGAVIGGAIGTPAGGIGGAVGAVAGAVIAEVIWQAVMGE